MPSSFSRRPFEHGGDGSPRGVLGRVPLDQPSIRYSHACSQGLGRLRHVRRPSARVGELGSAGPPALNAGCGARQAEVTFVTNKGWESITLLLAPTEVRGHLTQRQRESEFHLPRGVETLQVDHRRRSQPVRLGKATRGRCGEAALAIRRAEKRAVRRRGRIARDAAGGPQRGQ